MAENHDKTSRAVRDGVVSVTGNIFQLAVELEQLYRTCSGDPDFPTVIDHFGIEDDAALADLIEADGRLRLRSDLPASLDRYRLAIPDLALRADPLDAAIDIALRAVTRSSHADEASVETLIAEYPDLQDAIREAAALNNALWSTAAVRLELTETASRDLPCDFGPVDADGCHRYELRQLLGEGGFGQVYLAEDRSLSEEGHPALVAIKVLAGTSRSAWDRQRLIDEATKARRVNHPNVVRVLDRGISDDNEDFIVNEFVEGGDLGRWARHHRHSLRVRDVVRMAAKCARGVHAAHMAGLVHCDLKPNNIMVTSEGEPKVTDFGIAIRADDKDTAGAGADQTDRPLGNLAFMSPEQYRMEPSALTIPSDVYALGGILYWLLTNDLPNGATPEAVERIHRKSSEERAEPDLESPHPGTDGDLQSICRRALAVASERRYNSAASLAEDLERWSDREPIPWTKPSPWRRLVLWSRRKPALAVATALIIALAVVAGITIQQMISTRIEAAIAKVRLDGQMKARADYEATLQDWAVRARESMEENLPNETLISVWLTEWLYGPTVFSDGSDPTELWEFRIETVRDVIEQAQACGHGQAVETLLWHSSLGFWLIRQGQCLEAETLLAETHASLAGAINSPDDPWLEDVRAMQTCAALCNLAQTVSDSPPSDERTGHLTEMESILQPTEQRLNQQHPGSGLHRLLLEHLVLLYGPSLLDRPEELQEVEKSLAVFEEDDDKKASTAANASAAGRNISAGSSESNQP